MSILVISDLHVKQSEAHLNAIRKLFDFIEKNYNDATIIQLGDFFDSSAIHHNIVEEFIDRTKRVGKHWFILSGNHDKSYIKGNILTPLKHYDHLTIIEKQEEIVIDNVKCLFLPYIRNAKEEYEKIKWSGDFCFAHITNEENSFIKEDGVNTDNIDAFQVFGHTHTYASYNTGHIDEKLVLGVSLPTRNGENINKLLYIKAKEDVFLIDHNVEFSYEDIDYGVIPENKNNIYNIKKAPSITSVYEMYKGYHIREEGIELLIDETISSDETFTFNSGNIKDQFVNYAREKGLRDELVSKSLSYLKI